MYLRSGQLLTPPQRVYSCAYQIFYKEQRESKLAQGIGINMVGSAISKEWADLPQEEHDHYQEMFQKSELLFQEQLLHFYGGSDQDFQSFKELKNLPKKPTKPVLPQIQYVYDNKDKIQENNPNKNMKQIYSQLIEEYAGLDIELKRKFEREYEEKYATYQEQIENWNKQILLIDSSYADKYKNLKRTLEEKFKKPKQDVQFEYRELIFPKTVRKISSKNYLIKQEDCGIISNSKLEVRKGKSDKENDEYLQVQEKDHQKKQRRMINKFYIQN